MVENILEVAIKQWNDIVEDLRGRVTDGEFILQLLNEEPEAVEGVEGMERAMQIVQKRLDDGLPTIKVKGTDGCMKYLCMQIYFFHAHL